MSKYLVQGASELGEGQVMAVDIDDNFIAICRSGGELYAIDNLCTHELAFLSDGFIENGAIECPLHQGRFDLKTGAPLCPPVSEPVKVYRLFREDGNVYVEVEP